MKNIMLLFSLIFFYSTGIAHKHNRENNGNPVLVFINHDTLYDFGSIPQGESVENQFEIKNTGSTPLVITMVKCDSSKVTCKWTHASIKPGKTGIITITYTAYGDVGSFFNNIVITSNAADAHYPLLQIKGAIIPGRGQYIPPPKLNKKHNHNETCVGCYIWPPVSH
jgi:hypothetical protein